MGRFVGIPSGSCLHCYRCMAKVSQETVESDCPKDKKKNVSAEIHSTLPSKPIRLVTARTSSMQSGEFCFATPGNCRALADKKPTFRYISGQSPLPARRVWVQVQNFRRSCLLSASSSGPDLFNIASGDRGEADGKRNNAKPPLWRAHL